MNNWRDQSDQLTWEISVKSTNLLPRDKETQTKLHADAEIPYFRLKIIVIPLTFRRVKQYLRLTVLWLL